MGCHPIFNPMPKVKRIYRAPSSPGYSSHSEFNSFNASEIQNILCDRLVLVHGNPLDYDYGWDLESFGRVHDVDRKMVVHGENIGCVLSIVMLKCSKKNQTGWLLNKITKHNSFGVTLFFSLTGKEVGVSASVFP